MLAFILRTALCHSSVIRSVLLRNSSGLPIEASSTSHPSSSLTNRIVKKWTFVTPLVTADKISESRIVTGVEITPQAVIWATLDTVPNEVINCGSYPLLGSEERACASVMFDLAFKVQQSINKSDIFVLEDKVWNKGGKCYSTIGLNLLIFQAMLTALLNNENYNADSPMIKVFYIQSKIVLKLFNLSVADERVSSQHIVQRMMKKSEVGYILNNTRGPQIESYTGGETGGGEEPPYSYLNWSCANMAKKVWSSDDVWRENVTNAILTASAFIDLCLKGNVRAQAAVMKRTVNRPKKKGSTTAAAEAVPPK